VREKTKLKALKKFIGREKGEGGGEKENYLGRLEDEKGTNEGKSPFWQRKRRKPRG